MVSCSLKSTIHAQLRVLVHALHSVLYIAVLDFPREECTIMVDRLLPPHTPPIRDAHRKYLPNESSACLDCSANCGLTIGTLFLLVGRGWVFTCDHLAVGQQVAEEKCAECVITRHLVSTRHSQPEPAHQPPTVAVSPGPPVAVSRVAAPSQLPAHRRLQDR